MMEQSLLSKKQIEITLHKYQSKAFDSQKRFIALIAGTGGGKTYFGPVWLINEIMKKPNGKFLIVAPVYKMLERASLPSLLKTLKDGKIKHDFKKQEGKITLSSKINSINTTAEIFLASADRPDTLEGMHIDGAWLDEAGQMKYWAWIVIQARLGQRLGRALLTTTPYGMNWLYTEFWKRWRDGDKNYDVIQFTSIDNPYYPKEEFERAKTAMSKEVFEMRYMGQFRKMSGLIYADFNANHIIEPFEIPESWGRIAGIDFGWNNPFVFLEIAIDNDDNYYIISEYYQQQRTLQEHIKVIREITEGKSYDAIYCDPSGKQQIEDLKSNISLSFKEANNDVFSGIEYINTLIKTNRIKVFKTCKNFLDEIETYHWKEVRNGITKDEPEKENDHAMDALRYAIYSCKNIGKEVYYSVRGRLRDGGEEN